MKYRIAVLATAVVALIIAVAGCTDKETQALYQTAVQQMAAQADTIRTLKSTIQTKNDSLAQLATNIGTADLRADSLHEKLRKTAGYASNLKKELATLQDECSKREAELLSGIRERDSVLTEIDAIFSDTNVTLTNVRGELTDQKSRTQWYSDLVSKIRPWYKKWKHDSKRSFLKVLFAAGKAKTPDFPEPNLDSLIAPWDTIPKATPPPTDTSKVIQLRSEKVDAGAVPLFVRRD